MMWYNKVVYDLGALPDFIDYYKDELVLAKKEVGIKGNLEKQIAALPGITEHRFNQLQEIEAVLEFMNIRLRDIRTKKFRKFLEHYNKTLTSRDAEKYTDGEPDVITHNELTNSVALLRNQFLGIMKSLESKNFMLGHITRIRAAGLEDITI